MKKKDWRTEEMMKSMASLLASAVLLVGISASATKAPLIVGGIDAAKGEFPFLASLQNSKYGHFCGGSLIRDNWILTAAHCTVDVPIETVMLGLYEMQLNGQPIVDTDVESFKVLRVIHHPKFNEDNMDFDYALVQIDGHSKLQAVELNKEDLKVGIGSSELATVTGWGATNEASQNTATTLQKVPVPLVDQATCVKAYAGFNDVSNRMICAGYSQGAKDACQGDSGGPLVFDDGTGLKLIGITSWGKGCARPNAYGVYSKVSESISWIESIVNNP